MEEKKWLVAYFYPYDTVITVFDDYEEAAKEYEASKGEKNDAYLTEILEEQVVPDVRGD